MAMLVYRRVNDSCFLLFLMSWVGRKGDPNLMGQASWGSQPPIWLSVGSAYNGYPWKVANWAMKKKPGYGVVYRGLYYPNMWGILINHDIRIPSKQPVFNGTYPSSPPKLASSWWTHHPWVFLAQQISGFGITIGVCFAITNWGFVCVFFLKLKSKLTINKIPPQKKTGERLGNTFWQDPSSTKIAAMASSAAIAHILAAKSHWATLHLTKDATAEELRKQYRRLVRESWGFLAFLSLEFKEKRSNWENHHVF